MQQFKTRYNLLITTAGSKCQIAVCKINYLIDNKSNLGTVSWFR